MKKIIAFLAVSFVMIFSANADEAGAKKFAEATANQAVTILTSAKSDDAKMTSLEGLFKESVDTDWIGRFVVGKHWRDLEKAQQTSYLKTYKNFLVKHYTSNFKEYAQGTTFEITRSKPLKKGQYMVAMNINRPSAQPVKVDYRVREKSGKYSIIDIVVEGVSLLNTQRSEFSSVIQRKGVQHLIETLEAKS